MIHAAVRPVPPCLRGEVFAKFRFKASGTAFLGIGEERQGFDADLADLSVPADETADRHRTSSIRVSIEVPSDCDQKY
jgi:hypothetical protein